jgi:pyruvate ferredoxin oxidoreductase gamma subunit
MSRRRPGSRIVAMLQVRIHGRGGQGVVTAAELLSLAAFDEGRHAQAFPTFGSERMGAPVTAFCRIDDRPIRAREPITEPDALIVQDPTLLHQVDVFSGLAPAGYVLINTERDLSALGLDDLADRMNHPDRLIAVPATQLAREHLGRPLPNAVLLGAFAALTGAVSLDALTTAIGEKFAGRTAEGNVRGAEAAFRAVQARPEVARA